MDVITWRKAQQSGDQGGACVEVARFPSAVGVRDSKDPNGPRLLLTPRTFHTILNDLKR
ncbi:DUF397 domain-containing protein [Actinomadura darangshiensis]|uniref:DUF397 domain-containing protein n=1 Tax=Actinomadura darangshiensis TaxID=705336 RepID=A0A4R5AB15_9ACTN|nr:DUF397 domain-containing protein [Actinomadura darangshiensis]TDD68855.1 DUF397 domain-containing protein [Actinomadura darangshiensis]